MKRASFFPQGHRLTYELLFGGMKYRANIVSAGKICFFLNATNG